ncbi:hypothetical protein IQ255_20220 [Pleurocapsales cyanobacterium LEGE 10410]|nr:hypothetical protein [Pleurocapsales cyanobacterium LEGE 10410]
MEEVRQRGTISQRLTRELSYMIRERSPSGNSDDTILFLLEKELPLDTLVFCRCHVKNPDLAAEIEERILEKNFTAVELFNDLIEIKDSLLNARLTQKLYVLAEKLVDQKDYFTYPWLIAKEYPDLREKVGEYFLAQDWLDLVQIEYTMQFFSTELQNRIIERIRTEDQYPLFEMLKNSSVR